MIIQTQCTAPKKRKAPPPPPPPPVPLAEIQEKQNSKILSNDDIKESKCSTIDASPEYEEDEVVFSATDARRTSLSSLGTIDDIENSFEQTIAEAQRVIDLEEEMKKNMEIKELEDQMKSVSKSEVVTLHARLEQDITKQQIHSEISTAFNALQLQTEPIHVNVVENKEKELHQTEKQTDDRTILQVLPMQCRKQASSDESSDDVFERCNYVIRKKSRSKTKRKQKSNQQITDNVEEDTKKLENFTIGSYKSNESDSIIRKKISEGKTEHASLQRSTERKCITKSESFNVSREEWIKVRPKKCGYGGPGVRIRSFLDRSDKKKPNDNKVYGLEGSVRGIKGQVRLRCAEITDMGFSPALKEKSRSMLNLIPENNTNVEIEIPLDTKEENSSNANLLKRALSEHNLSDAGLSINEESKSEFAKEQERLQQEYKKLQKQFVVWQKQLMSNHTLLEKECLFPKKSITQENKSKTTNNHSQPLVKVRESKSLTRPSKPELLNNVTLSTWNSNRFTDYSTLPNKSSIRQSFSEKKDEKVNINLQDLKQKTKSLSSNGLRSSSNKTYFKPPAVRSSSTTRQRLPPEVRVEDDDRNHSVNITENSKERMSRRDSFQNIENSKTHKQSSNQVSLNNRKNGIINLINNKDVKSNSEISKENEKLTNKITIKGSVPTYTYFGGPISKNHHTDSKNRNYEDSWSKKENQQKVKSNIATKEENVPNTTVPNTNVTILAMQPSPPPPPPPPLPSDNIKLNPICQTVERKQRTVPNHSVDPRDKLMLEVRNFGGRKGLRKISNPEPAWQLNVFGPQSITKA